MSGEVHHLTRRGTKKSLFVRPIATTTRPDELKMEFSKFGAVRDVHIPGKNSRVKKIPRSPKKIHGNFQ